jgi:hypothetical protein
VVPAAELRYHHQKEATGMSGTKTQTIDEMIDQTDPATPTYLSRIESELRAAAEKFPGVKTVLVVLSTTGMVYDVESLRQKVHLAYENAAVFFITTQGRAMGALAPRRVDLVIDFSGPGERGKAFHSFSLKARSRFAVGRNAGLFRTSLYKRVFNEKDKALGARLPAEMLARERFVQAQVLRLAGIPFSPSGDTPPDRGKITPLELPPLQRS